MRIVNDLYHETLAQDTMLTIGAFDGIHLGHQAILARLAQRARERNLLSGMVTFHPHPRQVLYPLERTELLTTLDEKIELVAGLGVELFVVIPFTREFAATTAQEFARLLRERLRVRQLCIGEDFRFGRGGEGNVAGLRDLGEAMGFGVHVVQPVTVDGQLVSSTQIRTLLLDKRVREAARLLGRRYQLSGQVVHGVGRGRRLGFPTANIQPPPGKLVPGNGVYLACAAVDGATYHAVVNIGVRPSFDNGQRTIEAYLLDFSGDLYGRTLRLEFREFLREERPFPSVEALVAQIREDCERAREFACAETG